MILRSKGEVSHFQGFMKVLKRSLSIEKNVDQWSWLQYLNTTGFLFNRTPLVGFLTTIFRSLLRFHENTKADFIN